MFAVQDNDRVGPPYSRIWMADLSARNAAPWGSGDGVEGSGPRWSPDGRRIAFQGRTGEGKSGIVIANADGTGSAP